MISENDLLTALANEYQATHAELKADDITAEKLSNKTGMKLRASQIFLDGKVKDGILVKKKFLQDGHIRTLYRKKE